MWGVEIGECQVLLDRCCSVLIGQWPMLHVKIQFNQPRTSGTTLCFSLSYFYLPSVRCESSVIRYSVEVDRYGPFLGVAG